MTFGKLALFTSLLATGLALAAGPGAFNSASAAAPRIFTGVEKGVAVGGYDPVSYFADGKAVLGSEEITLVHEDAVWRFSTKEHRDQFGRQVKDSMFVS